MSPARTSIDTGEPKPPIGVGDDRDFDDLLVHDQGPSGGSGDAIGHDYPLLRSLINLIRASGFCDIGRHPKTPI